MKLFLLLTVIALATAVPNGQQFNFPAGAVSYTVDNIAATPPGMCTMTVTTTP